jgi:hypothetical protein
LSKILVLSMGDLRTFSLPVMPAFAEVFISVIYPSRLAQQQRQLGKNCGDAMRLVAREQLAAESATQGLDELTRLSGLAGPGARKIHVGS